jgi:leader peptidase (prepilin peptidase)/N-methyltransferase
VTSVITVLISAIGAILVSPLLASWTIGLTPDLAESTLRWWQPRPVGAQRLIFVATVAAILTAGAARGVPLVAWWLFAAAGAVLSVVDVQHHLLPGRLVYPLAAVVAVALGVSALVTGEPERLLRAILAAAAIGAVWFGVAFTAPSAMGLGDVRVAALAAGLLGWTSWSAVLAGQLAALLLAAVTAAILAVTHPRAGRAMQVPMGPALIAGAIVATWL